MISLVHATCRLHAALKCRDLWYSRAAEPSLVEHVFCIDAADDSCASLAKSHPCVVTEREFPGCIAAWNLGASASNGEILVQLSDDWQPPSEWDRLVKERIGDSNLPKVLAVGDGARKDSLLCLAILTRARLLQQGGELFASEFVKAGTAMYADNWFTMCAYADQVVMEARDLVFEHMHPNFGKEEWDEIYRRQNSPEAYDKGRKVLDFLKSTICSSPS